MVVASGCLAQRSGIKIILVITTMVDSPQISPSLFLYPVDIEPDKESKR
jgi:hypothetical protein